MYYLILFRSLAAIIFFSCNAKNTNVMNGGFIIYSKKYALPGTGVFAPAREAKDYLIWYKDSAVILESQRLFITSMNGVEQYKVKTDHYVYIDLRKRVYYDYTSFSDTARLIRKYTKPDSTYLDGCWNFLGNIKFLPETAFNNLPDTMIDGIPHNAYRWNVKDSASEGLVDITVTAFTRCDKKSSMFSLEKMFSKKTGCPVVGWTFITQSAAIPGTLGWLKFNRNTLTPEELKVFAAWEKAAQANPVK
jgi:hypothetical protein